MPATFLEKLSVPLRVRKNSDLILRSAFRRVSKDGRESLPCFHPSRRAQERAPQDEVGKGFAAAERNCLFGQYGFPVPVEQAIPPLTDPP